jgi:hypothetical protein
MTESHSSLESRRQYSPFGDYPIRVKSSNIEPTKLTTAIDFTSSTAPSRKLVMLDESPTFNPWDLRVNDWLKLPVAAMREVGQASQTLGAILKLTTKETFMEVSKIAREAHLPVSTVRKQLKILVKQGSLENLGRQKTPDGKPCRTCTYKVTQQARDQIEPYNVLPYWACQHLESWGGRLPWSSKAVLSVVASKWLMLRSIATKQRPDVDVWDALDTLGGNERFEFSLSYLCDRTGLQRESVVDAKHHLSTIGIVNWIHREDHQRGHLLVPNKDLQFDSCGRFWDKRRWSESG